MSKKWIVVAAMAVTAAGVLLAGGIVGGVLTGAIPALAQEEPIEGPPFGMGHGRGMGMGWQQGLWTMFDTVAEALGLTPQELFSESHDEGKRLTDIAEEQGLDMQAVYDAMKARRADTMREAIQQRVEDGSLSQEQADWLLEGLEQGFFPGGRGFGRGRWFGGPMRCPEER